MDFFSMLFNDPVVAASIAVIAGTFAIICYIAVYFVRNIIKAEQHRH